MKAALLRGLAIELIRKTSPKNFQAAIENLSDSVENNWALRVVTRPCAFS
jgi:hypothetical protein